MTISGGETSSIANSPLFYHCFVRKLVWSRKLSVEVATSDSHDIMQRRLHISTHDDHTQVLQQTDTTSITHEYISINHINQYAIYSQSCLNIKRYTMSLNRSLEFRANLVHSRTRPTVKPSPPTTPPNVKQNTPAPSSLTP